MSALWYRNRRAFVAGWWIVVVVSFVGAAVCWYMGW